MPTCFVIQPFDRGAFDKRFEDVFSPAIRDARLEPYRVDRDPGASIPMEQVEAGIRGAEVCLADVSTDNPNVWFEVGFAFASGKEVALVCASSRRTRFPFDIQHRNVIAYETDSSSDFDALRGHITNRLRAILSKEAKLSSAAKVASPLAPLEGLASHELVALVAVGQNIDTPGDSVSTYVIRKDMEKAGFTRIATTLGLASLLNRHLVSTHEAYDDRSQESYTMYGLTDQGLRWLLSNQDKLALTLPRDDDVEDGVPF